MPIGDRMPKESDEIYLGEWCGDDPVSLEDLTKLIPQLQKKFGKRAIVRFDAGYNNVSVVIKPTKKVKKA